jgi:hypothetical protein
VSGEPRFDVSQPLGRGSRGSQRRERAAGLLHRLPEAGPLLHRLFCLEQARLQAIELVLQLLDPVRAVQLVPELRQAPLGIGGRHRLAGGFQPARQRGEDRAPARGQVGRREGEQTRDRVAMDPDLRLQEPGDLLRVLGDRGEGSPLGVELEELRGGGEVAQETVGEAVAAGDGETSAHGGRRGTGRAQRVDVARPREEQGQQELVQGGPVHAEHVVARAQASAPASGRHTLHALRRDL